MPIGPAQPRRPADPAAAGQPSATLEDFKAQVVAATDIVELVGKTVALKKRGRDFLGLCPFHSEKTPSFHVNPARQFYYCFGCKAAGDAIKFVKDRDRVEFMDALKTLAADAGIPVPAFGRRNDGRATETAVCLEANSLAALHFEKMLADPAGGAAARAYLAERGITDETAKRFRIGLAPDGWDVLLKSDAVRKLSPEQLHVAGLAKQREREKGGGFYDTFRNRLMFPIRDPNGRVIAFGGRVMPGSPPDTAKYLNSPETPVFNKSRTVYGLDLARQRIVETGTVVVVEGYTDVVMAHQFGATNVVSPLGTALTEQHVTALRRFAGRIVLLFDADEAGDKAADKAVSVFLTQPIEIGIATLGEDLDPDEYLLKHGLAAWDAMVAAAPEALTFKWRQLVRRFAGDDGNNLTGQQKALEAYLDLIADARSAGPVDPIRWGLVVSQVAKLTGIPTEQLHKRLVTPKKPAGLRPQAGPGPAPGGSTPNGSRPAVPAPGRDGSSDESRRADGSSPRPNEGSAGRPVPPPPPRRRGVATARDRAERWILGVLLLKPSWWNRVQATISPEDFTDACRHELAEVYWTYQRDEGEPVFNQFLSLLGDHVGLDGTGVTGPEIRELAVEVADEVETFAARNTDLEATLAAAIAHLRLTWEGQERQKLIASLRRSTEQNLGAEQEADLLKRLQDQVRQAEAKRTASQGLLG
ncbi:MAG: primase [Phycisphaerales bacterium]|nr:primase [Phycisphaerales bacterium]